MQVKFMLNTIVRNRSLHLTTFFVLYGFNYTVSVVATALTNKTPRYKSPWLYRTFLVKCSLYPCQCCSHQDINLLVLNWFNSALAILNDL